MESAETANVFQWAQTIWRVRSIIQTYRGKSQRLKLGLQYINIQGNGVVSGRSVTSFMQGGYRAPALIKALDDGPSMGFTTGFKGCKFSDNKYTVSHTLKEKGFP